MPIPVEALGAILGVMLGRGLHEMVLRLFIQFLCYLRPGECSNLLVKQLIAPLMTGVLSYAYTGWVILLHPAEDKSPGKTGLFDATVMLDSDAWLHPILQALVMKRDLLFGGTPTAKFTKPSSRWWKSCSWRGWVGTSTTSDMEARPTT